MRRWVPAVLFPVVFVLAAAQAFGDSDMTFTLLTNIGSGLSMDLSPDPGPPCLPPSCVLFTGTLTDTDVDTDPSYPDMVFSTISVAFSTNPTSGLLSIDNTFYDAVDYFSGILSGDPNYATDNLGNPPNTYTGPLFGIDIAPGTTLGSYTGSVTINVAGGLDDPNYGGFTVTQGITVNVVPEPGAAGLSLAGVAFLMVGFEVRRKWHSVATPLQ